ncbi:unnamed protein product [Triticum turgidum subsp. durum]|uniref:Serine hydrolase domain-containing protein n=1 Tax=Triticum turgidum subsp. durum TaxID=4567 RepID=A0A9R1PRH2_TRITD|nr:unnamed protein product [Triticum turgidum subsp. durum]
MGSLAGGVGARRPRFLCLHGFRTSGEIMRKQVVGKWPAEVTARLDLVFADAPFPAEGKSDVDGIFDPPYYEWFQFDKGFTEYRNFDKCLADKAYANMIKIPSLHFLGDNDFLKPHGEQLIESFVDPFIIRHPKGHTVPRLVDETSLEVMSRFLDKMEKEMSELPSVKAEAEAAADVDEKEVCI